MIVNSKKEINNMIERICSLLRIRRPNVSGLGILMSAGDTVPADGAHGFEKGCIFQHTASTSGKVLFVNTGTKESASFVPLQTTTL